MRDITEQSVLILLLSLSFIIPFLIKCSGIGYPLCSLRVCLTYSSKLSISVIG